ncbi:GGDEF domain-containing protein [Methylophilus aquaticus]|uniref:Sensor domain-containing diguanylate cyclase n=1 Tax=Methylophilus aquaticus TaxID=1971610 RepID=A0ABT9JVY3_9PROT|nr:sensor domain-containing diguanylate cyclase [Methylophilus aquaticus]MDP8568301.1 sensor domain-containing diguanylate cyclase [Methylophilus aquaticus]
MQRPEIPENEKSRLHALRSLDILDTCSEERFDRLTRIAMRMFNVPVALVSLVDENRQWFKSGMGLSVGETARDISFCGHAILGDDTLVIPDTLADVRFSDNPLVTGKPHIRFYAGRPICTMQGFKIGTLCLIDHQPRVFNSQDLQDLNDLAQMVEGELTAIELAAIDELTQLSNRRSFIMLAEKYLSYFTRHHIPATLIFMDLNQFKTINDTYGHDEGDRALQTFAQAMKKIGRNSDIFARLGGDEFVILLANTTIKEADIYIQRLSHRLITLKAEKEQPYDILFAPGVVEFKPEQPENIEQLIMAGDTVMYQLKKSMPC